MLTDQQLEDILTRAYRARALKILPITPDDLIVLAVELKHQRRLSDRLRKVWLGEREPNQAVYQDIRDWLLSN